MRRRGGPWIVGLAVVLCMCAPAAQAETVYGASLAVGWHVGSDISNANFAVTTEPDLPGQSPIEMGLKAHARPASDLPQMEGTYSAWPGTAWYAGGGYDVATWNFDVSVALAYQVSHDGQVYLPTEWTGGLALLSEQPDHGAPGRHATFENQHIRLFVDFDPADGNAGRGVLNLSALLAAAYDPDDPLSVNPAEVYGVQLSENVLYEWLQDPDVWEEAPAIDPAAFAPWAVGAYEFLVTASPMHGPDAGQVYASVEMTVWVPEPGTIAFATVLAATLLGCARRERAAT